MENTKRNYGIDLLRIVSMMMVTLLHVFGQGGILSSTAGVNAKIVWFFEIAAFCAANCYAVISGYVGVNSKHKYTNIIVLYLQVIFYTLLIALAYGIYKPLLLSEGVFYRALFPFIFNHYWYFTAYFCLFFFMPFINKMLLSLSKREIKTLAITILSVFTILPTIFHCDVFNLNAGYSALWIIALYVFGGCIKLLDFSFLSKKSVFGIYALCVILSWLNKFYIPYPKDGFFVSYISPTMLIAAASLVILFSKLNIGKYGAKVISFFAPLSFGVFLIHTHPLVWHHWLFNRYVEFSHYTTVKMICVSLLAALSIWLICSLIDGVRHLVFKVLRIKKLFLSVENKIVEKK